MPGFCDEFRADRLSQGWVGVQIRWTLRNTGSRSGETTLDRAGTYGLLGGIGGHHAVTPAALQAWHILASSGSLADRAATFMFLLAVAGAGILARALPRTLAWSALALAVLQLLPDQMGFLASLVFLLWAAVAGIVSCSLPGRKGSGRCKLS
jgi:hypothetical protein